MLAKIQFSKTTLNNSIQRHIHAAYSHKSNIKFSTLHCNSKLVKYNRGRFTNGIYLLAKCGRLYINIWPEIENIVRDIDLVTCGRCKRKII